MHKNIVFGVVALVMLAGCAGGLGSRDYARGQARTPQDVQMGVVEHVREVNIEGTKTGIGAAAGATAGSVAGRASGDSPVGRAVGGIAGAVVGGVAGAAIEEGTTRQKGLEITVKLDRGRTIAIVQAGDEEFKVGDRVRIISGGGTTRVAH